MFVGDQWSPVALFCVKLVILNINVLYNIKLGEKL